MEENQRVATRIANDMSFIIDQNKKTKPDYDVPFIERWPSLKPFVNGGLAAFLQGLTLYVPFAAIYYSPLLSHVRRSPRFLGFNILAKVPSFSTLF